jgi:hypothetical protein
MGSENNGDKGSGSGGGSGTGSGDGDGDGDGGGNGSGGGMLRGGAGDFTPFMSGISYEVPAIAPIIQNPKVDYNAQLNALINRNVGLFEGII